MNQRLADATEKIRPVRQHVAYLDGLRALAALFVILDHSTLQANLGGAHLSKWMSVIAFLLGYGHYAVDVFIVLSGFCLAMPVVQGDGSLRGGAAQFFRRRARRILPPYFCALAFSLLLIWLAIGHKTGTIWDISLPVTRKGLLTHVLLIQDFFRNTNFNINPSLWSVSVEWHIYFLFPFLMVLRRRLGAWIVAAACTIVSYLLLFIGQHTVINSILDLRTCGITPQYLGLFSVGLLGADIAYGKSAAARRLRQRGSAMALLGGTTLLMIAVSSLRVWHGGLMPLDHADFFVGLWAASLLIAAANAEIGWLNRLLSWRPLVFLGTFAYSIYLVHVPMLQVIWQYILFPVRDHPVRMFWSLCLVGIPLILGTGYLFFLVCERPFLNTRRKETRAETERDAALSPAP